MAQVAVDIAAPASLNTVPDGVESLSAKALEIDRLSPEKALKLLAKQSSTLDEEGVARALTWLILNPLEVQVGWIKYSTALRGLLDRLFELASAMTSCAPTFLVPFASDAVECMESGRPIAAAALAGATTAMACVAHGADAPALMCCVAEVLLAVSKRTHELTAEELVAAATAGAAVDCTTGTGCPQLVNPIRELARAAAERARELRGSVLSDAAWTLARLETAGMVPPAALTAMIADRLDAASVLDLEPHELSRLAMVLVDSNVKSSSAANALAVAVRTHAEMTDGNVAWSSLEFLSLAQSLACLATAGRRDVGVHLSLAARQCSQFLQPAHIVELVSVLASLHLPLETRAAQALAMQLIRCIDTPEPVSSSWIVALEFLAPHASCLQNWHMLNAKVESELTAPVLAILARFLGRAGRGPPISAADAEQALQQFSLGNLGTSFTSKVLEELEVLASADESWVKSCRTVRLPDEVNEDVTKSSVCIMKFEVAGCIASGLGASEKTFAIPTSQNVYIRRSEDDIDKDRVSRSKTLFFLQTNVRAGASCAVVAALLEAFASLIAAAAGDASAGEWRLMSGDALCISSGSGGSRQCNSSEDEVFFLLAPKGFPCSMQELRVFRPHRASGFIRIFCPGRSPSPAAWLLVAELKRLFPRVVISIALDVPCGTQGDHAEFPPVRMQISSSRVPAGYERQFQSGPPPTQCQRQTWFAQS